MTSDGSKPTATAHSVSLREWQAGLLACPDVELTLDKPGFDRGLSWGRVRPVQYWSATQPSSSVQAFSLGTDDSLP